MFPVYTAHMALRITAYPSHMVLGRIVAAIIAVLAFIVAWRLLDVFLGVSFGIILWVIKALLFLALLYVVYRLFAGRHRYPYPR